VWQLQAIMSTSDAPKITDNFPHKSIPPIVGQPSYETIKELHLKLNENAVKVHSNLGNGLLGYLGVTVTTAIFNTLSNTPFVIPPNPGVAPVFPADATGPQITNIRQEFREQFAAFKMYVDVCNAISALIIDAIDPVYLAALRLPYVGIGTRTPLEILAHLYTNYANITPSDLEQNGLAMQQPCDVNQPIEIFYKQIEDAMEFADAGQTPYTPAQILSIAYQGVFRTGIFADDCKIWKRRAAGYKTWEQFKADFRVSYTEYSEALDVAPRAAGFHAEDYPSPHDSTVDAIANLATATAADRTAVANLTATNAAMTLSLAKTTDKLIAALTHVGTLTKQLADLRLTAAPAPRIDAPIERKHYCWTCGYRCAHSSWNCTTPAAGHKKRAKAADTLGGSVVNKPT
jgi:hypothetical protein